MPKLTDWLKERAMLTEPALPSKPLRHGQYRVNGLDVILDGRDLPAPCCRCRGMSEHLCDYPVIPGVRCAAPLCAACAKAIGKNKHLCPLHVKVLENRKGPLL